MHVAHTLHMIFANFVHIHTLSIRVHDNVHDDMIMYAQNPKNQNDYFRLLAVSGPEKASVAVVIKT